MLTLAIQAGGESRRMGRDKGLIPFLGRPLIARVIERLAYVADEIIVTTNKPDDYRFLGLPLFPDLIPGRGALGGLYTALSAASQPFTAVVACDMPFACPELLAGLRDALVQSGYALAIPHLEGGLEPFHAVYDRDACLPHIRAAIDSDKWRVDAWFPKVKVNLFREDVLRRFDPNLRCFSNVNTPEELTLAEQIASSE